jgi:hypothetical protein
MLIGKRNLTRSAIDHINSNRPRSGPDTGDFPCPAVYVRDTDIGRWNTAGRSPLIRLRYHPNFIRLKLPRACQSPVSTAVIDDNDLFGAEFGQAPSR